MSKPTKRKIFRRLKIENKIKEFLKELKYNI